MLPRPISDPRREELVVTEHVVGGGPVEAQGEPVADLHVAPPLNHVDIAGLGCLQIRHKPTADSA